MILGVVSDTHLPRFGRSLPRPLIRGLRAACVDAIVHCGDVVDPFALELFEELAPVIAVAGNNDDERLQSRLGQRAILESEGRRIGVVHGHAGPGASTLARAIGAFASDGVDAILFGHSHVPYLKWHGGVLLFNPGSPTDKRRQPRYSYGLLYASATELRAVHRYFEKP